MADVVGSCPKCGAPIWAVYPAVQPSLTVVNQDPPPIKYSCTCRFGSDNAVKGSVDIGNSIHGRQLENMKKA